MNVPTKPKREVSRPQKLAPESMAAGPKAEEHPGIVAQTSKVANAATLAQHACAGYICPVTDKQVKEMLSAAHLLLTGLEWFRAAVVYAHCTPRAGQGRTSVDNRLKSGKSFSAFAKLGIRGLSSHGTVSYYYAQWSAGVAAGVLEDLVPGDPIIVPPALDWHPISRIAKVADHDHDHGDDDEHIPESQPIPSKAGVLIGQIDPTRDIDAERADRTEVADRARTNRQRVAEVCISAESLPRAYEALVDDDLTGTERAKIGKQIDSAIAALKAVRAHIVPIIIR